MPSRIPKPLPNRKVDATPWPGIECTFSMQTRSGLMSLRILAIEVMSYSDFPAAVGLTGIGMAQSVLASVSRPAMPPFRPGSIPTSFTIGIL